MIRVAVDGMGGDYAPQVVVEGAVQAVNTFGDTEIILVGQEAARQALAVGVREVEVRVQGPGAGRETAVRSLQSSGLVISMIRDVTPIPHNGCRPRKRRRV